MTISAKPVCLDEVTAVFDRLLKPPLALAVSGGADSMSLMHLAAEWAQGLAATSAPPLSVVTIDHRLRPESAKEAAWVAGQTERLGLQHHTLVWSGEKPASGIQQAAREARYRLLADFVRHSGLTAVATGHNQDDVAETLLMRLARGSGVDGLASMSEAAVIEGVRIVRPLLGFSHVRLVETLKQRNAAWLEDPSNSNLDFERVRIRSARDVLESLGLSNARLALSASRLRAAADATSTAARAFLSAHADAHAGAYCSIQFDALLATPAEVAIKALGSALAAFGGQGCAPRRAKLEALYANLCSPPCEAAATKHDPHRIVPPLTLGGCTVEVARAARTSEGDATVLVFREPGRSGLPRLILQPGTSATWDRRFRISVAASYPETVEVAALGAEGLAELRKRETRSRVLDLPAPAARTLPAFWRQGELCAVPFSYGPGSSHSATDRDPLPLLNAEFVRAFGASVGGE